MPVTVEIRRGSGRFAERAPGRITRHSLAFGDSYDAGEARFGPMVCHDDHLLRDGTGFEAHRHRDVEIVTWVVSGALAHTHGGGVPTVVPAGSVAWLTTGDGVEHTEVAAAPQTRFVQVWLAAPPGSEAAERRTSSYVVSAVEAAVPGAGLVTACEPFPGARLSVARLDALETVVVPAGPRTHVYVARGALLRSSLAEPVAEGDAFRFVDEPEHEVRAAVPTELLVWSFDA